MFENLFFLRRRSTYALLYKLMVDSIRVIYLQCTQACAGTRKRD